MSEEPFDQDVFEWAIPVWTIVDIEKYQKENLPTCITVLVAPDVGNFLPLFTDIDLARTIIGQVPLHGKMPLELKTPGALRFVLECFERIGKHAGFDVSWVRSQYTGRFPTIRKLIATLDEAYPP
jgi:hypothetical protein